VALRWRPSTSIRKYPSSRVGEDRRRGSPNRSASKEIQIGAALGPRCTGSPRLVDHQHQPVAIEHAGLNFIRGQLGNFGRSSRLSLMARNR